MKAEGIDLSEIEKVLDGMDLDRSVGALSHLYRGGTSEAKKVFRSFLENRLDVYTGHRNQPQTDDVSHMSKYLHFSQISPIWLALEARNASAKKDNIDAFVEELVIRRELSMNFVLYTPDHDSYSNLPDWAKKTLEEQRDDDREHTYTRKQLESAETHEEYWNAAMKEIVHTGYMHNYMRVYWGEEDPGVVEHARARLQDHALPQQQILPRRPRPELLRQRSLDLRPARPWLE